MQIETLIYRDGSGWNSVLPKQLDSPQTLVLAFGSRDCQEVDQALAELRSAFKQSVIVGCSTSGEILADRLIDNSLTVAFMRLERTTLAQSFASLQHSDDSRTAGIQLGEGLASEGLRAVLLLSDGIGVNGSQLVEGLNARLGHAVRVIGGMAGDGDRFERTWILEGGERVTRKVSAVGFYGPAFHLATSTGGGWSDFGPERRITRSQGQVLYELDGRPALALYKSYLGDLADGLPGTALRFPLQVKAATPDAEPLVRTVVGIDESQQSMIFAGDIPMGGTARLMRATHARLVDAAGQAASEAVEQAATRFPAPALALSVSCVGRRMILGQHTEDEIEVVTGAFPAACTHIGFYSYGEIVPAASEVSRLHNQTIAIGYFSEDLV